MVEQSENKVYGDYQYGEQKQIGNKVHSSNTSGRCTAPDCGRGGKAFYSIVVFQNYSATQESDPYDDLAQYPGKVDIFAALKSQGQDYKGTSPYRNQHVGLESGVLTLIFPFDANQ